VAGEESVPARRRTKIVATLGPATDDPGVLEELIRAGADVLRVNFSHGDAEEQRARVKTVREVAARAGRDVPIMGDLQGPKIRIESFASGPIQLQKGVPFVLDTAMDPKAGSDTAVGVAYPDLVNDVEADDVLLLDDGRVVLRVEKVDGTRIQCRVHSGGKLTDNKGVNKQGGGLSAPALTDKDRTDIKLAASLGFDFLSVSFARTAADIEEARQLLRDAGGHGHVVAKIERTEAVENIEEIIAASDVIMVARGDLAVEVGYAAMTGLQKSLIRSTRLGNRVVITATQMLESMISETSPTRAEVSDVANAVMDGTDAVMLSAETAVGSHPVQAVRTMSAVCVGAEKHETFRRARNHRLDDLFEHVDEAIAMAAMYIANHLEVTGVIALTESGATTLWMSRLRSDIPIYAFTRHQATRRRVMLYRGVYPESFDIVHTDAGHVHRAAFDVLLTSGAVKPGDKVLFTSGDLRGIEGRTNTLQIIEVPSVTRRPAGDAG